MKLETSITLEFHNKERTLRLTLSCPGCRSNRFFVDLQSEHISRIGCKVCGDIFTFPSSLLVPLKQLSKNPPKPNPAKIDPHGL